MEYTNEIPTEAGVYFRKCSESGYPKLVHVISTVYGLQGLSISRAGYIMSVDIHEGLWLGPFTDEDLMK